MKNRIFNKYIALPSSICVFGIAAIAYIPSSNAQAIPRAESLPGSIDPGRVPERFSETPMPSLAPQEAKPQAVPPTRIDAIDGFVFKAMEFEGNTAFSDDDLGALMSPYIGMEIDDAFAEMLANYLSDHYRKEGYFLSKVFITDIDTDQGMIKFNVVEGYIERIEFQEGSNLITKDWQKIIGRTFNKIKGMKPLHGPTLERYLLLINDLYGLNAGTALVPLTDMENPPVGGIGMVVALSEDRRLSNIEFNNYGSVFTGPGQGIYNLNTGTPVYAFDNLRIQFFHAFPVQEMRYAELQYSFPIGTEGLISSLRVNRSLFRPGDRLKPFELKSVSESFEVSLRYPLIRSRAENLYVNGSFELRNSTTDALATELYDDRLRIIQTGLSYEFMDGAGAQNILGVQFVQGLNILGARETGSFNLSRQEGHSDFTKIEWNASRLQDLPWGFNLLGGITGQYAFSQLLSSEEFGYGGQMIGRAYDSSEIAGDHGISAFIEARYTDIPTFDKLKLAIQPYAFYDIGKVWNIENGQDPESGASTGAGVRFYMGNSFTGNLNFSVPLTRSVENPKHGDGTDPRVFFQLNAIF